MGFLLSRGSLDFFTSYGRMKTVHALFFFSFQKFFVTQIFLRNSTKFLPEFLFSSADAWGAAPCRWKVELASQFWFLSLEFLTVLTVIFQNSKLKKRRITLKTIFQKIREMKKDAKQLLINGFFNQLYQIKMNAGKKYNWISVFIDF